MTTFVAIDGEAIGQGADTRYALLCASTGQHAWSIDGLSTETSLSFLCDQQTKGVELVCFGLGYDVNQWLVDLPVTTLRELWRTGSCIHKHWRICWTPGRRFEVYDRARKGRWAIVCETFGFFQQSFVKALTEWGFQVPAELAGMKTSRGQFTAAMRDRIIDYCHTECRLLVDLMGRLELAAREADCLPKPHWWIGAGQLASAMLASNGVAAHHRHDNDLAAGKPGVTEMIMRAYFGGRAEILRQGERAAVTTYDLRSAYPWAATLLPSLAGAKLIRRKRFDPSIEHGIFHATWQDLPGLIMPLPVRHSQAIHWPRSGEGVYHACELAAALHAGFQVSVRDGWELRPDPAASSPFHFVPGLYAARAKYKAAGHPAQRVLKLALNSLYGKTAQGVAGNGRPRWQSYLWAGEITARTRARMLTLALAARDPMMIATDGLFAQHAPARPARKIGGWEHGQLDWLFCAQPGVYQGYDGDREVLRSRGFFARDIDYRALHAGWKAEGPDFVYTYQSHRFIGLGQALQRTDGMTLWRSWIDQPRSINLRPQRKNLARSELGGWACEPIDQAPGPSEPYVPKVRLLDSKDSDNEAGMEQPLRETV